MPGKAYKANILAFVAGISSIMHTWRTIVLEKQSDKTSLALNLCAQIKAIRIVYSDVNLFV